MTKRKAALAGVLLAVAYIVAMLAVGWELAGLVFNSRPPRPQINIVVGAGHQGPAQYIEGHNGDDKP